MGVSGVRPGGRVNWRRAVVMMMRGGASGRTGVRWAVEAVIAKWK